jgi:hypothetical protein
VPWQKVFLPGRWKKLVKTGKKPAKTGKNWQKLVKLENAVSVTGIRS